MSAVATISNQVQMDHYSSDSEDQESIYSIQDRETDRVKDTTDTDSKSEYDWEVEVEYEVASTSEGDEFPDYTSSGTDDLQAVAEGAIAAVLCDSTLEAWATDGETSDSSSTSSKSSHRNSSFVMIRRAPIMTCVQCNTRKTNPLFRFCEKCFQVKKNCYPPRPRGKRKRKLATDEKTKRSGGGGSSQRQQETVKLDTLQSCLNRLSQSPPSSNGCTQDSGLGSSQEWNFDRIVVPAHLTTPYDEEDAPSAKRTKLESDCGVPSSSDDSKGEPRSASPKSSDIGDDYDRAKELENCIMCNSQPKNGIFLHASIAHRCCCYKCAMRTWKTKRSCPICNCKIRSVVKMFTV